MLHCFLWGCIKCEEQTVKQAACDEAAAGRGAAGSSARRSGAFAEERAGLLETRVALISPGSFVEGFMSET